VRKSEDVSKWGDAQLLRELRHHDNAADPLNSYPVLLAEAMCRIIERLPAGRPFYPMSLPPRTPIRPRGAGMLERRRP
jgi:hypothetical protein